MFSVDVDLDNGKSMSLVAVYITEGPGDGFLRLQHSDGSRTHINLAHVLVLVVQEREA